MVAQAPTGARGLHCKRPGDAPCLRTRLEGNAGQARSLCNALFLSSAGRVPPVPAAETRRAEACAVGFPPQTGQHWGGPAPLSTAESRPRPQGRTGYPGPQAQSRTALPNPLPRCLPRQGGKAGRADCGRTGHVSRWTKGRPRATHGNPAIRVHLQTHGERESALPGTRLTERPYFPLRGSEFESRRLVPG